MHKLYIYIYIYSCFVKFFYGKGLCNSLLCSVENYVHEYYTVTFITYIYVCIYTDVLLSFVYGIGLCNSPLCLVENYDHMYLPGCEVAVIMLLNMSYSLVVVVWLLCILCRVYASSIFLS
jgi:hypothetical protein